MDMINNQDIKHMIPPIPPRDTEPPVGSPIPLSLSLSIGSSSPVRSTTPLLDYPFDESIFADLDNSLWIIPRPLKSEPVPGEPNETKVKKMEDGFYNLTIKGNGLKTYIRRFQELTVLCPNMIPNTEKLMEVFIGGLPRSIEGNVTASKPQTLEEAITIT
ncbi:hypothetical protein Tco_1441347 [Tanacetum coccineum]